MTFPKIFLDIPFEEALLHLEILHFHFTYKNTTTATTSKCSHRLWLRKELRLHFSVTDKEFQDFTLWEEQSLERKRQWF